MKAKSCQFLLLKKSPFFVKDMSEISGRGYKPGAAGPASQLAGEKKPRLHIQADIAKELVLGGFIAICSRVPIIVVINGDITHPGIPAFQTANAEVFIETDRIVGVVADVIVFNHLVADMEHTVDASIS